MSVCPVLRPCLSHPVAQTSVAKATEICPERLEVHRTPRSLDSEISCLKFKITTQQDQQGGREEIVRYVTWTLVASDNVRTAG